MRKSATWFVGDRRWIGWLAFLFLVATTPPGSMAQLPTATILGVVNDSTGAVVPGAQLTARSVETGQTRAAVAADDGSYRFAALAVGNYEVRVEHPGFRSEARSGLQLTVGQEAVVNFTLEVGAMKQTVSVTAEAPLVNTTSGTLGGLVDERKIADLPLNGRNYIDLTLMQPGVQQHRNLSSGGGQVGTYFSSSGAPLRSNRYLLDGASMVTMNGASSGSITSSTLGVEGIREYRVVTNSYSAEYGITMGSQMMIVSKSGTNAFHGSLFEYMRNSALDARNFFDYKTAINPRRLPAFARNNFGASFGGPLQKDKTFFFAVYEGLRERLGRTLLANTIATACRGPANATITNTACPQLGTVSSVTIAPVTAPLLALYPEPNLPDNRVTYPFSQPTTENYGQIRVDRSVSNNDTAFARYTIDGDESITPGPGQTPPFRIVGRSRSQFATLSENHIFSPTLLNTFRFSFSRTVIDISSGSGLVGPQYSFLPGREIGTVSVGGLANLGPGNPATQKQNIFTWSDDLFYTRGRHSLKFGTLINRYQQFMFSGSDSFGSVQFANLTSFLLGQASQYTAITPGSIPQRTFHFTTFGFYTQDDWRVVSGLTLNLGLRYEFHTEYNETNGYGSALRDIQHDASATLGPPFKNPTLRNVSPRFGFAWDVRGDGKTALRGGFGLLYDIANLGGALQTTSRRTPPFASNSAVVGPVALALPFVFPAAAVGKSIGIVDYLIQQPHMLQYNLTVERQLPFAMALTLAYGGSRGINIVNNAEGNPTVPAVLPDGRKFWTGRESRTNPNWADIDLATAGSQSWYNSLQVGLVKRLARGLQFQSAYTWSKVLDETQSQIGGDNNSSSSRAPDPSNLSLDKGPAAFDLSHNGRFNFIYRMPELTASGGAAGKLVNGWWFSSILSLQSGYPFSPVLQTNRSRSLTGGGGRGIDRPDLLPGRHNDNIILGGPDRYYDPAAFALQEAGFLGTAGRNILRGPAFATLDFSLGKDMQLGFLGEGRKLEFRAEFFDLLNRANFVTPGLGIGGGAANTSAVVFAGRASGELPLATAAKLTGTTSSSRQVQLALKLIF